MWAHLAKPRDAGKSVEARVETEDLLDAVLLHDGQMRGVASREFLIFQHDLLGPLDRLGIHRQHLIHDAQQCIKGRLDGAAALDELGACSVRPIGLGLGTINFGLPRR